MSVRRRAMKVIAIPASHSASTAMKYRSSVTPYWSMRFQIAASSMPTAGSSAT